MNCIVLLHSQTTCIVLYVSIFVCIWIVCSIVGKKLINKLAKLYVIPSLLILLHHPQWFLGLIVLFLIIDISGLISPGFQIPFSFESSVDSSQSCLAWQDIVFGENKWIQGCLKRLMISVHCWHCYSCSAGGYNAFTHVVNHKCKCSAGGRAGLCFWKTY